MTYEYIDRNVARIRDRMDRARIQAGREDEVLLLAAVKSAEVDEILYLHRQHGICDVGENRVQQLMSRWEALPHDSLRVHFIGSLQTNKVKYIIDKVCMIHSVDSWRLAREIDRQAEKHGLVMDILVEINCGREEAKGGLLPEEVADFCESLRSLAHVNLRGFMTMAPKCEQKDDYFKYFQETYQLIIDIWQKKLHNISRPVISMGMSDSFEEAILAGSDIVRIGRSLFLRN